MDETLESVDEFHRVFGLQRRGRPTPPDLSPEAREEMGNLATRLDVIARDAIALSQKYTHDGFVRVHLIAEELGELAAAMSELDLVKILDGLSDLTYVVDGSYVSMGLSSLKLPAFREVHRSNMSKLGADGRPVYTAFGRVGKGPNYTPPDLAPLIARKIGEHFNDVANGRD